MTAKTALIMKKHSKSTLRFISRNLTQLLLSLRTATSQTKNSLKSKRVRTSFLPHLHSVRIMQADTLICVAADIPRPAFTVCGQANGTRAGAANTQWTQM